MTATHSIPPTRIELPAQEASIRAALDFQPERLDAVDDLDGLSLYLAKKSVDELTFTNHGRAGIEALIRKRRSSAHIQHIMPREELSATGDSSEHDPAYSIRPARESDALEISRCAWMTYGYTYEDYIYYPERIIELNRSGELRSLVAVSAAKKAGASVGASK